MERTQTTKQATGQGRESRKEAVSQREKNCHLNRNEKSCCGRFSFLFPLFLLATIMHVWYHFVYLSVHLPGFLVGLFVEFYFKRTRKKIKKIVFVCAKIDRNREASCGRRKCFPIVRLLYIFGSTHTQNATVAKRHSATMMLGISQKAKHTPFPFLSSLSY